jgi:phosphoribosyl 1,2-cyclic phosphodiesterase
MRVLIKRYGYKVYASVGTLDALMDKGVITPQSDCTAMPESGVEAGELFVSAFHTSHDSRESLGFRVSTPDDRSLAVATDTGCMTDNIRQALYGCDLILLESNHDIRMLKNGAYPYYLKQRILANTGHLSNDCCAAELPTLAKHGTTRFVLGHLSKDNNIPELAYTTSRDALASTGLIENKDYLLSVAPRDASAPVMVL